MLALLLPAAEACNGRSSCIVAWRSTIVSPASLLAASEQTWPTQTLQGQMAPSTVMCMRRNALSAHSHWRTTARSQPPKFHVLGTWTSQCLLQTCCAVEHERAQKTSGWSGLTNSRSRQAETDQLQLLQCVPDGQLQAPLAVQQYRAQPHASSLNLGGAIWHPTKACHHAHISKDGSAAGKQSEAATLTDIQV